MRIRKFGHACLQVMDGDANVLIDPGTFSTGYQELTGLTAILITHGHADHLDMAGLAEVLGHNPHAVVYADAGSAELLAKAGIHPQVVQPGDRLDVGTTVTVSGGEHAVVHQDIPVVPNVCYFVGGRLLHPGDSLVAPDEQVEILALPVSAPWMALKEGVEFFRAVRPAMAIPIHDGVLASPAMAYRLLGQLGPADTEWLDIDDGRIVDV